MDTEKLQKQLIQEEGIRLSTYLDSRGVLTIGVGHNLAARGISRAVAMAILAEDIQSTVSSVQAAFPWWATLDDVRQRVIVDLAFNMGITALLTFHTMLANAQAGNWVAAASNLQASKWFGQVGHRGPRLVAMLRDGVDSPEFDF